MVIEQGLSNLSFTEATRRITDLIAAEHVGAIFVLGSPIANPFAEPLAERILAAHGDTAAIDDQPRFTWGLDAPDPQHCLLSEPKAVDPDEEGIKNASGYLYPRERDDDVRNSLETGDNGPFADCGMLMLDTRRDGKWLGLMAGHGGCGTIAAVRALGDAGRLSVRLGPEKRVVEILEVERRLPKGGAGLDLDELEIVESHYRQ